jgi:hypothetical protein
MPTQSNLSGGRGGLSWGALFEGLRQGHVSAYFVVIALAVAATVAFWAGTNMMKKDTSR